MKLGLFLHWWETVHRTVVQLWTDKWSDVRDGGNQEVHRNGYSSSNSKNASHFQQVLTGSCGIETHFSSTWDKINREYAYYRDLILIQELLPMMHGIAGYLFDFQQDNAAAYHAHSTVDLLYREPILCRLVIMTAMQQPQKSASNSATQNYS